MRAAEWEWGELDIDKPGFEAWPCPLITLGLVESHFSASFKAPLFFSMYEMDLMPLFSLGHHEDRGRLYS